MVFPRVVPVDEVARAPHPPLRLELSLRDAHGICNGKKIPWEGELNLRFDP